MYHTKMFYSQAYKSDAYYEYSKWLEKIQEKESIEIVAVTGFESFIIVTYKTI